MSSSSFDLICAKRVHELLKIKTKFNL